MRTILFWLFLPLRAFTHLCRYVFGHPIPFVAVFAVLVALFSYLATIQIAPDVQAAASGNHQRIVMMFPSAGALAATFAMVCGCLLIWMGEHLNKPITTWTLAPSIWTKSKVATGV